MPGASRFKRNNTARLTFRNSSATPTGSSQRLSRDPHFSGVFTVFRAAVPSLYVDIDRTEVQALQVPMQDVFTTLNVYMGGLYVNQFNEFGFTWQVQVEAAPDFRTSATMLKQFQVRTSQGADGPARLDRPGARRDRAPDRHALQHVRLCCHQRHSAPERQHGNHD